MLQIPRPRGPDAGARAGGAAAGRVDLSDTSAGVCDFYQRENGWELGRACNGFAYTLAPQLSHSATRGPWMRFDVAAAIAVRLGSPLGSFCAFALAMVLELGDRFWPLSRRLATPARTGRRCFAREPTILTTKCWSWRLAFSCVSTSG